LTGKGPLRSILDKKIQDQDMQSNFQFAGYVDRRDLIKYYQNASVYVLPSYFEGLPTTLLEAMSCGIASVATDVDGSSEVIINGKTGLLVSPKNPKQLSEAILKLLDSDSLRKTLGLNARKYIVGNHDWTTISSRIEEVYYKLQSSG